MTDAEWSECIATEYLTPLMCCRTPMLEAMRRAVQLAIDRTFAEDERHQEALAVRDLINMELHIRRGIDRRRAEFQATAGLAQ